SELVRILKAGGKIYINTNGLGWYKHLWYSEHNKTEGYDPQKIAAQAWMDTYQYNTSGTVTPGCNIIIEPKDLVNECKKLGISDVQWDGEGLINNPNNTNTFFQKEYYGDIGVYEILGLKS
ncbi:MAG: hypothetical protein Q8K36_00185, partial [Alphaproteobacteria bacterium]|nr:hypothetical protein [Alphaproteobacteria bacterium]